MLQKIREFAETGWSKLLDALSAQIPFTQVVDELDKEISSMLQPLERRINELDNEEIFALLILRQLDANIKLCRRDGAAPLISSLVYFIEDTLYNAIVLAQVGKRKEAAQLRDMLSDAIAFFEYEWGWNFYIHTLYTMHRLYRIAKYSLPAIEGFAKWAKKLERSLERGLAMRGAALNFYLPPYYLYRGHLPTKITPEGARRISQAVTNLWDIAKTKRVKLSAYAPIEGEEKGIFWSDFYEGLTRTLNERLNQKYGLPVMDAPLIIRVAYDEEAQYTQSVAYFKREGEGYSVTFFKPKGARIVPAEEAHIVFHEVIPGHAYANYLEDKFGFGGKPVTTAWSVSVRLFPSIVDVFSILHEGWALLAQELGANAVDSEEVKKAMINEILLYVERVLVVEKTLPFYTVKLHIPRLADPYQFSSYFVGYIIYRLLVRKKGMESAIKAITQGIYPYIPSETEFVEEIERLKADWLK